MKTRVTAVSEAINTIEYDSETLVLSITMAYHPPKSNGEHLKYVGVPNEVFQAFLDAESKGQFFNFEIRDRYEQG